MSMTTDAPSELTRAIEATLNAQRPYGASEVRLREEIDPGYFAQWLMERIHDALVTCDVHEPELLDVKLLEPTAESLLFLDEVSGRIMDRFSATLAAQQKPFRSATKVGEQHAQMAAGKNPNQKRLDAMRAEYQSLVDAGVAVAAPILPARRAEEYFRMVPRVAKLADPTVGLPQILDSLLLTDKWNPAHCFTRDSLIYVLTIA